MSDVDTRIAAAHPFAAITTEEIDQVRAALDAAGLISETSRFVYVMSGWRNPPG